MRVNIIWSFLFEYFVGRNISFKNAWKNHKKKLFLVTILFISLTMNVKLFHQSKKFRNAYHTVIQKQKEADEALLVCEMNIVAVREMNRKLSSSLDNLSKVIQENK